MAYEPSFSLMLRRLFKLQLTLTVVAYLPQLGGSLRSYLVLWVRCRCQSPCEEAGWPGARPGDGPVRAVHAAVQTARRTAAATACKRDETGTPHSAATRLKKGNEVDKPRLVGGRGQQLGLDPRVATEA